MAPAPDEREDKDEQVLTQQKKKVEKVRRYRVVFHNDDFTTQQFVIEVLMRFFHKSETEAVHIMLNVHHRGQGVAGVYTRDVAETKVEQTTQYAREHGHPLLVTAEPE